MIRRFMAIFKKEMRQLVRDPLSLSVLIFVPAVLLALYGYALTFDVKNIATAVLDEDRTTESRAFLERVFESRYFVRCYDLERLSDSDALLARGRVRVVLHMPRGFGRERVVGHDVDIQVLVDGADANTASILIGYLDALVERENTFSLRDAKGVKFRQVVVEPRVWFNPELKSGLFLVPGLMGMLLLIAAVIATSLSIVREKERETIEQIRVSPVRPLELILGKVMPYMLVCILTMALVLGLARVLFGVTVAGSFFLMVVVTLVFLFASLGLGLLISTITRSQQVAYQVAVLVSFLPSIMLSGFIFPIKNMPVLVQAVTLLVVPRYFVAALRDIMLRGASWSVIWPQLVGMLVLGILFNGRAVLNMRKDA